jgi:integrase
MPLKTPSYRLHAASGQAIVRFTVNGRRRTFYLGPYDSPKSKEKYHRILAEVWQPTPSQRTREWPTIEELMAANLPHCQQYYAASNETEIIKLSMRPLRRLCGEVDTCDFGPRMLKRVQQAMVGQGLTRQGVNKRITKLRRMFKWGVAEELVPARVLVELKAVAPLSAGRTEAPESTPIGPASQDDVDAALEHMPAPIAAMVQLQQLTGMRPGEVVLMRRRDLDTTGAVWTYVPPKHKNQWRMHGRRIKIGPKAQEILKAWLPAEYDAFVFSPRRFHHNANFREAYDTRQYRKSIYEACDVAGVPRWAPNQLRHAAATLARNTLGIERAAAMLGHSRPDTTALYAARNDAYAEEVAKQIG